MTTVEPMRKTAAVTGAASGIGRAFSRRLCAEGFDLVLIDRSEEGLLHLLAELGQAHPGRRLEPCVTDLTLPAQRARTQALIGQEPNLDLLVNAAGFGTTGCFAETDFQAQLAMIELHVTASVTLCRAVLPGMLQRNRGAIINVASIAAFTRFPETATYTATKAFLVAFTECLQAEVEKAGPSGVKLQALCAGQTQTGFNDTPLMRTYDPSRVPAALWMTPERLVELSLAALAKGSGTYVPLLRNRFLVFCLGNGVIRRVMTHLRRRSILEWILRRLRSEPVE